MELHSFETRPRFEGMTIVCAWCDALLVTGGPEASHGLCEACFENLAQSIKGQAPRRPAHI